MTMSEMIIWFTQHYSHMKVEMQQCFHSSSVDESNPYHIEDDCWSHTMMVCKMAEINTDDKAIMAAALLHDIGKPLSLRVNPKNNHVQFFGHEEESAKMAKPILAKMVEGGILDAVEAKEALELVALHGFFYSCHNIDEAYRMFAERRDFFLKLSILVECDHLGRFCLDHIDGKFASIKEMMQTLSQRLNV